MSCGNCGGKGTKPVSIFSTVTQRWITYPEACQSCNGSGQVAARSDSLT